VTTKKLYLQTYEPYMHQLIIPSKKNK